MKWIEFTFWLVLRLNAHPSPSPHLCPLLKSPSPGLQKDGFVDGDFHPVCDGDVFGNYQVMQSE